MIDAAMPIAMRADFTSRSSTASKQFYNTMPQVQQHAVRLSSECVYVWHLYTVSQKKQDTKLLPITLPNIGGFSKFFRC